MEFNTRVFIEQVNGKTKLSRGISSDFAMSKLGATLDKELEILVEDDVAQSIVSAALPAALRARVKITRIGSASALARQLAATYVRGDKRPVLAIFDGDQRGKQADNIGHAKSMAENTKPNFLTWMQARVAYLPSESWPEAWLIQRAALIPTAVSAAVGAEEDDMVEYLKYGLQAGKHEEFREISRHIGLNRDQCLSSIVPIVCGSFHAELDELRAAVAGSLVG